MVDGDRPDGAEEQRWQELLDAARSSDGTLRGADRIEQVWEQVAPEAELAAANMARRAAWRTILRRPAVLAAAAAALLALGAGMAMMNDPEAPAMPGHDVAAGPEAPVAVAAAPAAPSPAPTEVAAGVNHPERRPGTRVTAAPRSSSQPPPQQRKQARRSGSPARPAGRKLACGAVLGGASTAKITVERDTQREATVRLQSGRISLQVPRLGPGGRLSVVTPDAVVRVRGTRFTVSRADGATTVTVQHGAVEVSPTGRGRPPRVLRQGETMQVQGVDRFLARVRREMDQAIAARDFTSAAERGRRYLAVCPEPKRATGVKLRLAGVLGRLGQLPQAAALYHEVSRSAAPQTTRENALALQASMFEEAGDRQRALASWKELAHRFDDGAHAREAMLRILRYGCGRSDDPDLAAIERRLRSCCSADRGVRRMLEACAPKQRP